MRTSALLLSGLLLALVFGCAEEKEHDPEVTAAFDAFTGAIKARDAGRLWDLSPTSLHTRMQSLYDELAEVIASVRSEYPESDRDLALQSLAAEVMGGVSDGRELFMALIDFDAVTAGAATERGLLIESVTVTGDEATVETRGGETFNFVREAAGWKATTLVSQLDLYPSLRRLQANMKTAARNIETWSKATQETTDRSKPEGTINVVARAARRGARVMVYQLLDKASVEHMDKAAVTAKELVEAVKKRFPDPAVQRKYLDQRQLSWALRVSDGKSVFAELWDAGKLQSAVPPTGSFDIEDVQIPTETEAVVTVTADGKSQRFQLRRELGKWQYAAIEPLLVSEGLRRLERELREVATAPAPE